MYYEPSLMRADYGEVEMPWWTYGARGMQLWFPSSLAEPLSPTTRETMGFGSVSLTSQYAESSSCTTG